MVSYLGTIDDLRGKHKNRPIFVMGTSGSLDEIDLNLIKGYTILGTNHFFRVDKIKKCGLIPTYLLMVDRGVLRAELKQIMEHPSVKLILRDKLVNELRNSQFNGECYQFSVWPKPNEVMRVKGVIQQVNNTAHYAIEIAHRMLGTVGPAKIVLLGVDLFYPSTIEKRDHGFDGADTLGCRPNFQRVLEFLPKTVAYFKRRRIELVTCSPWKGPLSEILIQKSLEEVLAEVEK